MCYLADLCHHLALSYRILIEDLAEADQYNSRKQYINMAIRLTGRQKWDLMSS